MDTLMLLLYLFISIVIFLILICILIKLGLIKFLDNILPFPFLRKVSQDQLFIDNLTYEGHSFCIFILSFPVSIPFLFLHESNYLLNFIGFFGLLIPGFLLLLRIHTFSDDNILPEVGWGYDPSVSFIFSWLAAFTGFVIGFPRFYSIVFPLYIPVIVIIITLISCMVPMFPDYVNKIVPSDVRTEEGGKWLIFVNLIALSIQNTIFLYFAFVY